MLSIYSYNSNVCLYTRNRKTIKTAHYSKIFIREINLKYALGMKQFPAQFAW